MATMASTMSEAMPNRAATDGGAYNTTNITMLYQPITRTTHICAACLGGVLKLVDHFCGVEQALVSRHKLVRHSFCRALL